MTSAEQSRGNGLLVVAGAVAAAFLGLAFAWWLAQPDGSISQYERLGAEIGCQCGTCPLRPIATCGCGFAGGMLEELRVLVDEGHGDDEIMTTLAARYDESVRIKPDASGLGLTAWAAPILLLTVGAVSVSAILLRWASTPTPQPESPDADSSSQDAAAAVDTAAAERSRLEAQVDRELDGLGD